MTSMRSLLGSVRLVFTRRFLYGYAYSALRDLLPVKCRDVLLESHHGKDFGGNPYYLAQQLASDPLYRDLRLIMVGPTHRAGWLRQHLGIHTVTIVKPRGLRYIYHLATSKWLISDVTFPMYFSRRPEQKYLNTWHGTPLKTLGRDSETETALHLVNIQRNFFHASHVLAPNAHTENVLADAYCMSAAYQGRMIRLGYPRNDPLALASVAKTPSGLTHIAFMPTWRGGISKRKPGSQQQISELAKLFQVLDKCLPPSVRIWVKLHPLVAGSIEFDNYQIIKGFPSDRESYEHLATCDAVVTDYSSVFFDFAVTRRPILRYIPDESSYGNDRGFCLDPRYLPFPCARTPVELLDLINKLIEYPGSSSGEEYVRFVQTFNPMDRGTSARDVCRAFFQEDAARHQVPLQPDPDRIQRVAISMGSPIPPPTACVELLGRLDTDRYAFVLLLEAEAITSEWDSFLKKLDPNLPYVVIQFHPYISPPELLSLALSGVAFPWQRSRSRTLEKVAKREYRRLMCDARFDTLISFCGTRSSVGLIENGHEWHHIHHVSPEAVAIGRVSELPSLQPYLKPSPSTHEKKLPDADHQ